ncbi:sugar ABC transporter substrate-binding protein [Embleya sp. NPDC005575]|uniref:sugar ABC transporter substrate-binding protein n=1 Tax=Embleya sp. NPDC005575 TaxID=3156892 RepID=UPI0033AC2264
MPRRSLGLAAALGVSALVLAACSSPSGSGPDAKNTPKGAPTAAAKGNNTVAVITHGSAGDAFWSVVQNGAQDAGKKLGVDVQYQGNGDPAGQARLIDNAVTQGVGGIVVSMANPDALANSIKAATAKGIPVITINSGQSKSTEFGAIAHVGQDESIAGEAAGAKLKQAGRTKMLCVIHEAGNIGLNQRCDGAKAGFGGQTQTLQVDIGNPTDIQARIRGALQSDSSIDAVLALNPQVAAVAVGAVGDANSKAQIATFDLNPDVVTGIKDGKIVFAVDQQQYLQGYLPVMMIKLYRDNANTVGGGKPVLTGPGFVDKSNVGAVAEYAQRGTR